LVQSERLFSSASNSEHMLIINFERVNCFKTFVNIDANDGRHSA